MAVQAGAGIVYDSDPASEQQECISKAKALFRAAEQIPGVQVRENAVDASGRAGVAVTRAEAGVREELVFNAQTYAYLGHNSIAVALDPDAVTVPEPTGPMESIRLDHVNRQPGDVIYKSALIRIGIADRVGQVPSTN